jgi:16S rRNA (uracil1498-N3)-methyltransferase
MRSHRFFAEIPLTPGNSIELPSDAAHHCSQVLRYKIDDPLSVFNGDGFDYSAKIKSISKKSCEIQILNKVSPENESPINIHLIQGIARGDKMDLIIQKAVELGVSEVTPLFSERCNVKLDSKRLAKKMQHWQKVMISACEQSGRAVIPKLNPAINIESLQLSQDNISLILEPSATESLTSFTSAKQFNLLIGPEGGFSERDLNSVKQTQIKPVRMGPRILRTETAGLSAIAILQSQFGDLTNPI